MINQPENQKVIMHIDMDCFYAACMTLKYPELKHKPIVISYAPSNSIIVTSSYEARALGVKTGMPLFEAQKIAGNKLIQVDPIYSLYSQISNEVFQLIYDEFCKQIEETSIDEAFIDVTNLWQAYGTPKKMAIAIKNRVKEKIGITCSIGISSNRFLAKTASPMNKPDGVFSINPKNYKAILWNRDIEDMWGVGRALVPRLKAIGINKVSDLAKIDDQVIVKAIGKYGLELKAHANGIDSDVVVPAHDDYKSISNNFTLDKAVYDEEKLLDILFDIAKHVSERAVEKRMVGKTVSLAYRYKWKKNPGEEFDQVANHHMNSRQTSLSEYTNDVEKIYAELKALFYNNVDPEKGVNFLGVSLTNCIKQEKLPIQMDIDHLNDPHHYVQAVMNGNNSKLKPLIHTANNIEHNDGKFSEQASFFRKDRIQFNPKAKK